MRAINHALTGAVIGLSLPTPVALPLALASHFVLDAIPHWGTEALQPDNKRVYAASLVIDAGLCLALVVIMIFVSPDKWLVPSICAFLAASPDIRIKEYLVRRSGASFTPKSKLLRFHYWIQWYDRPLGLITEVLWAPAMILLMIARI